RGWPGASTNVSGPRGISGWDAGSVGHCWTAFDGAGGSGGMGTTQPGARGAARVWLTRAVGGSSLAGPLLGALAGRLWGSSVRPQLDRISRAGRVHEATRSIEASFSTERSPPGAEHEHMGWGRRSGEWC